MIKQKNYNASLPAGLSIVSGQKKPRVPRRPKHSFYFEQLPYELTPFMIAPVLAGETMNNLLLQARTVTSALKNKLIGHHLEHYFFYVKLRDLADSDDIVEMLMTTAHDDTASNVNTAAADNSFYYVKENAPNWLEMCTDAVVDGYFRDEGDTDDHVGIVSGLPLVMWHNKDSICQSLIDDDDIESDTVVDATAFPDHEQAYQSWEWMRQMQLTELTFEDYLGTFGVNMQAGEEPNKPELIRFMKNWTYPTNTVDGDGSINTQATWSIQERADKSRFFKEPGFIVGYSVLRPKLYVTGRVQSSVSLMSSALSWLPAVMKDQAMSSLKKFWGGDPASPISSAGVPSTHQLDGDVGKDYWVDIRDLLIYGDEFTPLADSYDNNCISPQNIRDFHKKKYPIPSQLTSLGVSALTAESDGVVSLNILGTQVDMT